MSTIDLNDAPDSQDEVSGWKEIAEFLGVSERTARTWEKELSLPVYRRGAAIVAVRAEIEVWKRKSRTRLTESPAGPQEKVAESQLSGRPNWVVFASVGLVLIAAASLSVTVYKRPAPKGPPTGLAFDAKNLIVHDDKGQEVWRYGLPALVNAAAYVGRHLPLHEWIGDIDGDGKTDVLFIYAPLDDLTTIGTPLFCFSADGRIKWKYIAGRHLSLPDNPASPVYGSVMQVLPEQKAILVSSNHSVTYPHQITLLSGSGRVLGEYWHPGHLYHRAFADLDGNGKRDLLLAGVNNHEGQATLIVLDMDKLAHATVSTGHPESGAIPLEQMVNLTRHIEKAVVFFPRSCLTKNFHPYNRSFALSVHSNMIEVSVSEKYAEDGPYLVYHLDFQLNVLGLTVSDAFESTHKKLEAEGKLSHTISLREIADLKKGVVVVKR